MLRRATSALLAAACLAPVTTARDLAQIRKSQRLEVASGAAELPFEKDLLVGFGRAIGAEVRVTSLGSPAAALQAVADGRADVGAGGLVSQLDRREGVAYSGEVFPSRLVAVTRKPANAIRFLEQMRTLRLLAPPGTGAAEALGDAKLPASRIDGALPAERALASLRAAPDAAVVIGLYAALVARKSDPDLEVGAALGARQLRSSPSWRLLIVRNLGEDSLEVLARSRLDESP